MRQSRGKLPEKVDFMSVPELGLVEVPNPGQLPDNASLVVLGPGIGTSVTHLHGRLTALLPGKRTRSAGT